MSSRLRPLVWPVLILALAAALYVTKIRQDMVDFEVYRTAGRRALASEPLYRASDEHYQFKYLPAFAIAMAPFAMVDPAAAKAIWFALSAGLLSAFVRWSVRSLPERRRSERALIWLTVVLMAKFYAHELTLGQTNILLGTLIVGSLLAVQVDEPRVAGGLIGAAVFVKPYALILVPWLWLSAGAAAAAACAAVLAAGLVLPALLYGWTGNVDLLVAWYRTVTESTTHTLLGADNVSLAAMWSKWIGMSPLATALATMTAGAILSLVATAWIRRQNVHSPEYLECALLLLLVPVLSPQGWDYVLLLGTPAVVLLVDRWSEMTRAWQVTTGLSIGLMGLTVYDLMGRALYARFMALSIVTLAAIGAAVALTQLRWKSLG